MNRGFRRILDFRSGILESGLNNPVLQLLQGARLYSELEEPMQSSSFYCNHPIKNVRFCYPIGYLNAICGDRSHENSLPAAYHISAEGYPGNQASAHACPTG